MMNKIRKIICMGAANVDRVAQCKEKPTFGESNPVHSLISVGGVASNIARNLKQFDHSVGMLAYTGNDDFGQFVKDHLSSQNIDISLIQTHEKLTTASYTAVTDPDGSLILGLEDMGICKELSVSLMKEKSFEISQWPNWLLDANIPSETVEFLTNKCPEETGFFASMVSPAKVRNLIPAFKRLTALFANKSEISALYNITINSPLEALEAAQRLKDEGIKNVFITLGKYGVAVCSDNYAQVHDPFPIDARHDNGAGDAFASAVIDGLIQNLPILQSVYHGLASASLTLESKHHSVGKLTRERIQQKIHRSLAESDEKPNSNSA